MAQLITPLNEEEALERLEALRRAKLREIADQITFARDRGFAEEDKYIAAKGLELARQVDVVYMIHAGLLKDDDVIWARNWWTGNQERITIAAWKKAMEDVFWLRQSLREREQEHRNEVQAVFDDGAKTVAQKTDEIEQIEVPPLLGLPETSVKTMLAAKKQEEFMPVGKPFVPEVQDIKKEGGKGYFHIKFTLVDPSDPTNKSYPVDYSGPDLDFKSDTVKAELWQKYGYKIDQETTE